MFTWSERPIVQVDLDAPPAKRLSALLDDVVAPAKRLLQDVVGQIPSTARPLADAVRLRTAGRFQEEAVAVADRLGSDWRSIMLANISYDLTIAVLGCSTMAAATSKGPVLARNLDWWPEDLLARGTFQFRHVQSGSVRYVTAGWAGALGVVTGMSARGFAVALNAVTGPEGVDPSGYPVLLHLRRVVEDAGDFDEAVTMLTETPLAAPALFTVVGTRNDQRVVIERSPRRHAHRRPDGDEPLLATNDYRSLFRPESHDTLEIYRTTCARYEAMGALCARMKDPDDDALLYVLTEPRVLAGITAQHVIFRPRDGWARVLVPHRLL